MNTKKIAVATTLGAFAVLALLFAYPAMAAASGTPQNPSIQQLYMRSAHSPSHNIQLSVGQTITLTSVAGGYWVVGEPGSNGTASGTMTLQVTGALSGGYTVSVTGGTLTINGTAYTITGGSAELGPHGRLVVGQGQAGSTTFLFLDRNLGSFGGASYGVLRVDLRSGSSEFGARLLVTTSA
ncbi:MAG: hypothetical protein KGI26_00055 [Thaumarchaeota archaeon]|nr:hypothetical protein [Nitrososphaerota archaeon]